MLIVGRQPTILIDNGLGDKQDEKFSAIIIWMEMIILRNLCVNMDSLKMILPMYFWLIFISIIVEAWNGIQKRWIWARISNATYWTTGTLGLGGETKRKGKNVFKENIRFRKVVIWPSIGNGDELLPGFSDLWMVIQNRWCCPFWITMEEFCLFFGPLSLPQHMSSSPMSWHTTWDHW